VRLLLDEMYSPRIATALRERGHDVVCVVERPDLAGRSDAELLALMATEERALVTNNVDDFTRLVGQALAGGGSYAGVVFTSDRSLPRSRAGIGEYVRVLGDLLDAHPAEQALRAQVRWVP
jgi:hypothetical protein